jgi:phage tail-like protein
MSCGCETPTFRLLDMYTGWDVSLSVNLAGFDEPAGVCLAPLSSGAVDPSAVLPYIPPAGLALGCGGCGWVLLTHGPGCCARVLRLDRCCGNWVPVWQSRCGWHFENATAIAAWETRLAVADGNRVFVWTDNGARLIAEIAVKNPGPIALSGCGETLVAAEDRILRFGRGGAFEGFLSMPSQPHGPIDRLACDGKCGVWAVTPEDGGVALWRALAKEHQLRPATIEELQAAFAPTSLAAASQAGFCLAERDQWNYPVNRCFSWCGARLPDGSIADPQLKRQNQGNFVTLPIDRGIPGCRWHRIQLDADVPAGAAIAITVATTENPTVPTHPDDWTSAPGGAVDFLINQPPGRYLLLKAELTGDGFATPLLRRIRIDFPRATSLDRLPAIYRENPDAEDFSERFLALFDASIAELDRAIERYPALLNSRNAPEAVLPWLGKFFDIAMDPAWDGPTRRRVLQAAPQLYRQRGTVGGMKTAIALVFGFDTADIAIDEPTADRTWGAVGSAQIGSVRLFGKARARFRLGASLLGQAPLRSFGNPDQDPLLAQAFRFTVSTPPVGSGNARTRLQALIDAQKPAHTRATLAPEANGFVAGPASAVGVDTILAAPPPFVLRQTALGGSAILRGGTAPCRGGLSAGGWAVGGNQALSE